MTSTIPLPSLAKSYFFTAFSALVGIVYPIVTLGYVGRIIGPVFLGKYYFANSLATYFLFAACLGIPTYGAREIGCARGNPESLRNVFSELFALNLVSTILVGILYGITVAVVPHFRAESALFGIFGILFLSNAFMFDYLYVGLEQQGLIALRSVVAKLLSLVFIYALVKSPRDYLWFAAIVVFNTVCYNLMGIRGLKYWLGMARIKRAQIRRHMPSLIWIVVSLLFINVYINLDSVILGFLAPSREVGLYNAAVRPCRVVATLLASFSAATLPRQAYYIAGDDVHASRELQNKSFNLLCLLSLPIACTIALSASVLVPLLYGEKFIDAIPTLVYSAPLVVLNGVASFILFQILFPRGREFVLVATAAVGAAASLVVNILLIPILSRNGAVLGALIAEVATIVVEVAFIWKWYPAELMLPSQLWKYVVASAGLALMLAGLLQHVPHSYLGLLASWTVSALVYCGLLWVTRESIFHQIIKRAFHHR